MYKQENNNSLCKNLSQDTINSLNDRPVPSSYRETLKWYWEHVRVVTCKQTYLLVSTTPPTLSILQFNLPAAINLESSLEIKIYIYLFNTYNN